MINLNKIQVQTFKSQTVNNVDRTQGKNQSLTTLKNSSTVNPQYSIENLKTGFIIGSSPFVALKLKQLTGSLDEKLIKAKNIILSDMGLPADLVVLEDKDLKKTGYAACMLTQGKILYDKTFCQQPNSDFSDDAVMCILRHELDHLVLSAKLYKKLGKDEFKKLITNKNLIKAIPEDMRELNFDFYEKISKYINVDNFDEKKYIDALNNYYSEPLGNSHYKNFNIITKNFDNAFEDSARRKQYELQQLMDVTTLKDFYSMIDETKILTDKIKAKGITNEKQIQKQFDDLYMKAVKQSGLEDKIPNWAKIIKVAREINKIS